MADDLPDADGTPVPPAPEGALRDDAGLDAVVEAAGAALELPAAADALAEQVTLLGSYDDAARLVDAWFAAGADSLTLVLPPGRPEQELADMIDVAADVAAQVRRRS